MIRNSPSLSRSPTMPTARKALDWFSGFWADRTAAARFARRVRQARTDGAEAKAEKITQANTMTQPSRQMAA